jgi:hypothetical protein
MGPKTTVRKVSTDFRSAAGGVLPNISIKVRRDISELNTSNQLGGVVKISCAGTGVTAVEDDSLST